MKSKKVLKLEYKLAKQERKTKLIDEKIKILERGEPRI